MCDEKCGQGRWGRRNIGWGCGQRCRKMMDYRVDGLRTCTAALGHYCPLAVRRGRSGKRCGQEAGDRKERVGGTGEIDARIGWCEGGLHKPGIKTKEEWRCKRICSGSSASPSELGAAASPRLQSAVRSLSSLPLSRLPSAPPYIFPSPLCTLCFVSFVIAFSFLTCIPS